VRAGSAFENLYLYLSLHLGVDSAISRVALVTLARGDPRARNDESARCNRSAPDGTERQHGACTCTGGRTIVIAVVVITGDIAVLSLIACAGILRKMKKKKKGKLKSQGERREARERSVTHRSWRPEGRGKICRRSSDGFARRMENHRVVQLVLATL